MATMNATLKTTLNATSPDAYRLPPTSPGTFDPYTQPFALYLPDGKTKFVTTMEQIQYSASNSIIQSIYYGTQIGAAVLMAVMLYIMTQAEKRRSVVFLLNLAALICVALRSIFQVCELHGPLTNLYSVTAETYHNRSMATAKAFSILSGTFSFLAVVFIQCTLITQVHVISVGSNRACRLPTLIGGCLVSLVAVGFRLALTVVTAESTMQTTNPAGVDAGLADLQNWLASIANITLTASIAYYAIAFCTKLAKAINNRRQMGLKDFGPMQIIFIGSSQTLCVPLIFAVITYFAVPKTQINSFVIAITAIFTPVSTLWANAYAAHRANRQVRRNAVLPGPNDSYGSYSTNRTMLRGQRSGDLRGAATGASGIAFPRGVMAGGLGRRILGRRRSMGSDFSGIELPERPANNIGIDRTVNVQHDDDISIA